MKLKYLRNIFVGLFAVIFAGAVNAAEFVVPESEQNPNLNIGSTQTRKDLYTVANTLTVTGQTQGDLVAAGGMVTVDGSVEQDLILAGGNVYINGNVGDDARIGGGNVNINSRIGGDLLVGGGNITIGDRAEIMGDLIVGGGNVIVNAPVRGMVRIGGGTVTMNSRVEGDIRAVISESLVFGAAASVGGKVSYKSPKEAIMQPGANVPNLEYTPYQKQGSRAKMAGIFTAAFLIKLAAWFLAAWLLYSYRKSRFEKLANEVKSKPIESLGLGLLALIAWPLALVILLITAVGYYISIVGALAYVLLLMVNSILAATFMGYWLLHRLSKQEDTYPIWQIVLVGVVLWHMLSLIPFVGWIINFAVFLMIFGAVVKSLYTNIKKPAEPAN